METNKEIKHSIKKENPNYLLPIFIIIGVPLILALLITLATLIFQPYARGCEENGKGYSHLEQFTASDGCNTCTCNDGDVICTQMECTVPVQSINSAIELLKEIYPEFDSYPDSDTKERTGPTTVVEEDKVDPKGGWYIAFILRGDDEKIVSGRCLSIDNYGDIGYLGDAIPETMEIDIKTCKEPISPDSTDEDHTNEKETELSECGDAFNAPIPSEELNVCISGMEIVYETGISVLNDCWANKTFAKYIEDKNLNLTIQDTKYLGQLYKEGNRNKYGDDSYWRITYGSEDGGSSIIYIDNNGKIVNILECI